MQKKINSLDSIFVGLGGTSPALSISATIAVLMGTAGLFSVGSILYSAIIIFGIALSFIYLSKIKVDDGSSFTWVTSIFGKFPGFISGWAILIASITYLVSAATPTASGLIEIFRPDLSEDKGLLIIVGLTVLAVINLIVLRGVKFASKIDTFVTGVSLISMIAIAIGSVIYISKTAYILTPTLNSLFVIPDLNVFISGALITIFLFWGFDVSMNVSEETSRTNKVVIRNTSIVILTVTIIALLSIFAVYITIPSEEISKHGTEIIFNIANMVLPKPFGLIAITTILISSIGAIESSIIQFIKVLFTMSKRSALHPSFQKKIKKWDSPWFAILMIWLSTSVMFLITLNSSTASGIISASINATCLQIAIYYSLTGLACAWHFRKKYKSVKEMFLKIIYPTISSIFLIFVVIYSLKTLDKISIGIGFGLLSLGIIPYFLSRKKIITLPI